jgi:DNA-binding NtrC family response regulator
LNESILVVDDDSAVRKTLLSILSAEGYVVEAVENGKKAQKAIEEQFFDVVLIDIQLPDMKGTELLLKVKQKLPMVVRIIITGFPALDNAIKAVNEGADAYVLKPIDITGLLQTIRNHLDEKAAMRLRLWVEMERGNRFSDQMKKPKGSIF